MKIPLSFFSESLLSFFLSMFIITVEFMGNDIKSPVHKSLHPMYVSYASIPTGSASTTQIIPKNDSNNQFGVVLTSINNANNTNSLSSTYIKNHNNNTPSSLNNISRRTQSPTHFQLIDHRQLSSSSNLSQYNSRNNLISKSASTQQIIKRNPSFNNSGSNRSEIRYTEIISTADDILSRDEKDVDTNSTRSYFMPSSQASTAAASPITTNKLMATNLQQQQLISRSFGIQNPLNNLIHDGIVDDGPKILKKDIESRGQISVQQSSPVNTRSNHSSPTVRHDCSSNTNKYQSNQINQLSKGCNNSHQISSPDKYTCVSRSPNLNHMPRRRPLPPIPQDECLPTPREHLPLQQTSSPNGSNNSIPSATNRSSGMNFCDQIREKPMPMRYNLNQYLPEYNVHNPLPAIPPHMFQHPMYRVRSQDRIGNRLKRQSGAHSAGASPHENQRPRSFCNNSINYQDYKDIQ